jgi:hypothetical protein
MGAVSLCRPEWTTTLKDQRPCILRRWPWVLNEKRLTERAGLSSVQDQLRQPEQDLGTLVADVRASLELRDDLWMDE